jgi:hypothetical protein
MPDARDKDGVQAATGMDPRGGVQSIRTVPPKMKEHTRCQGSSRDAGLRVTLCRLSLPMRTNGASFCFSFANKAVKELASQ